MFLQIYAFQTPMLMKLTLLIVPLIFFSSCSLLWEFRDIEEVSDYKWMPDDVKTFDYTASEAQHLNVFILIRHVHGFPAASFPVHLEIEGSEGSETNIVDIDVMNGAGNYVGEGSGDLWDIKHLAQTEKIFKPGEYQIRIGHAVDGKVVPLIMEVGIQLEKP